MEKKQPKESKSNEEAMSNFVTLTEDWDKWWTHRRSSSTFKDNKEVQQG